MPHYLCKIVPPRAAFIGNIRLWAPHEVTAASLDNSRREVIKRDIPRT